jgi:FHS family L-fucose permease-like MFS transporter
MLAAMEPAKAEAIRIAEAQSVQGPYLALAAVVFFVAILFALVKMPEISDPSERNAKFGGILKHKHLVYGVIAQFFYVGAQASIWGYYVDLKLHFAADQQFGVVAAIYRFYEGMTPTQMASFHASFAFVLFMIGRFAGTWLLTKVAAHKLLAIYAAISAALMLFAYVSNGLAAVVALSAVYFFMSIMFPTIFALSIKNLGEKVKIGSGLVIMAIVGGAVLPPLTGYFSLFGIENALLVPFVSFLVILFFGLRGYKVESN